MDASMKQIKCLGTLIAVCAALIALPASAAAASNTWGQEVKACNATSCYPEGTDRGAYVMVQSQDSEAPGYASEIQNFALDPQGLGNGGF